VLKDISDTAAWDSTNRDVITVSPAGLVTATGPGNAEVSAVFASVRGAAAAEVVALPSAYLIDGLEYAFDYQLDALGRVVSYRISGATGQLSDRPDGRSASEGMHGKPARHLLMLRYFRY